MTQHQRPQSENDSRGQVPLADTNLMEEFWDSHQMEEPDSSNSLRSEKSEMCLDFP